MNKLLLILLAPLTFIGMELPVVPLSPRSRELARQSAVMNANQAEQKAFQDEATNSIIDLESEVWVLQKQVERLLAESGPVLAPQIDATVSVLRSQAVVNELHDQQIATLESTQKLQSQLLIQKLEALSKAQQEQTQRDADLQKRLTEAENSNYYLKWALGITTVVTTTAFSIMGYFLWKNQQEQNNGNLITVNKDSKGNVIGFSQARNDAPYVYVPRPASQESKPAQPTSVPQSPVSAPQPASNSSQSANASNQVPAFDPSKYVTVEYLNTLPKVENIIGRDGRSVLHKVTNPDGTYTVSPARWPNSKYP